MMRVDELIAALSEMDPKAPVTVWNDGELYDLDRVEQINSVQAKRENRHKHTVTLS